MNLTALTFLSIFVPCVSACTADDAAYKKSVECSALAMARFHSVQANESNEMSAAILFAVKKLGILMQEEGQKIGLARQTIAQDGVDRWQDIMQKKLTAQQIEQADSCLKSVTK